MTKKFLIEWTEETINNCSVYIEAETEEEAIKKWNDRDFDDYEREEANNSFSDIDSIKEEPQDD